MHWADDANPSQPEKKQRWGFVELNDFKSRGCWIYFAYGWLWFMGFVGVAVYAVDTFTAVNLLVFDRWSSQVKPAIPFRYSRWIFAGCIFLSWALCFYEWIRAIRVIRRDGVAASYMDPIAMSVQSMRSKGFKRFLVYSELTKSKKGTDYVAFFVYFAFQSALRVILAEGPRQVVNALTLYAVMQARLLGQPADGHSQFEQFFDNIGAIAKQNYRQALIYASMSFTLVIWVFSALCLIGAGILYIVFLWHYIPQRDGRLRIYCRRKIDRRLEKIVAHKVEAALEDEARQREKAEKKAELKRQKTGELPPPPMPGITRVPTLPDLSDEAMLKKDDGFSLSRQDTKSTVSTLPLYSSRPGTSQGMDRQPSLPDLAAERPAMPSRTGTQWSNASFESNAPLLPNAGFAGGDGRVPSPAPTYYSRKPSTASFNSGAPGRMNTGSTQTSQRSFTPVSAATPRPPPGQRFPVRSNTGFSFEEPQSAVSERSPVDIRSGTPLAPLGRVNTADGFRPAPQRQESNMSYFSRPVAAPIATPVDRRPTPQHPGRQNSFSRPFSPAYAPNQSTSPTDSYEMSARPTNITYTAFSPTAYTGPPTPIHEGPRRNITVTGGGPNASGDYFGSAQQQQQRSFTAPPADNRAVSSYGSILDEYGAQASQDTYRQQPSRRPAPPQGPPRAYTAVSQSGGWR